MQPHSLSNSLLCLLLHSKAPFAQALIHKARKLLSNPHLSLILSNPQVQQGNQAPRNDITIDKPRDIEFVAQLIEEVSV